MSRKVVVTGGAGFIGSHLTDALVAQGHAVCVVDNLVAGKLEQINLEAKFVRRDVRDIRALVEAFSGIDTVFHLAALPRVPRSIEDPVGTRQVNLYGTMNVLAVAQAAGVRRVIFASSSSVYGDPVSLPVCEDAPLNPLSPYAEQKRDAEVACRIWSQLNRVQTVCLRFFNVYGRRLDPSGPYALVIGKFISQRLHDEPLTVCGDGEQSRDFTHVCDVVRAGVTAMDIPDEFAQGTAINIGCGKPVAVNRIAELIGGSNWPVVHLPVRKGEPRRTHADITLARQILEWEPTIPIEEGIADLKKEAGLP